MAKYRRDEPENCKLISLVTGSIKILEVHFSLDKTLSRNKDFSDLLVEMRGIIKTWKIRNLALEGKVIILRSLIGSKPVYIVSLVHTPKCVVKAIQTIHKEFIRENKKPKIKHLTTIASYCDAGLKDTDTEAKFQSFKFSWITWLKDQDNFHPWKVVADKILRSVGGTKVFDTNLGFSTCQRRAVNGLLKFYQDLLNLFTKFSSIPEETMSLTNILDQHLWNSKYLTKNHEPVYHQTFLELGLNTIHDLLDDNGQLGNWNL